MERVSGGRARCRGPSYRRASDTAKRRTAHGEPATRSGDEDLGPGDYERLTGISKESYEAQLPRLGPGESGVVDDLDDRAVAGDQSLDRVDLPALRVGRRLGVVR